MATQLTGSPKEIPLGEGYQIRAPGLRGSAELRHPRTAIERSRSRTSEDGTRAFNAALAESNITEVRQVEVSLQQPVAGGATRALRSVDGQEMLELQVPDLGPATGQLVLVCDEAGVLTWHFPVDEAPQTGTPAARGSARVKRFLIPATRPRPADAPATAGRSLLGIVGRKLLKVLVYPILDPIVGEISAVFAEHWEKKKRPYGLRNFGPENFRDASSSPVQAADWQRLAEGRALLFIHGTFSTAHSAFAQIPDAMMATLHTHYSGRVIAFNHFSLSHDPKQNAEWLFSQVPAGQHLDVDIVCHSRGGLVARTIAQSASALGLDASPIRVHRVVFVGVPNNGTLLAHPEHMVKMLDRLTTALNLAPTGVVSETLEAILAAVKIVGHGALGGLDGLAAMRPGGAFLNELNGAREDGGNYFAVAANFEPAEDGWKALLTGSVADAVMDRVFEQAPNDLVVPEDGVYGANGSQAFPLSPSNCLRVPDTAGVMHTTLFGYAPATDRIQGWLMS